MKFRRTKLIRSEQGTSIIEVALATPVLLLILAGAVDFGRGFFYAIEVSNAAEAGALYGTQNPGDLAGMDAAATLDANEVVGLRPTASTGCECSDGSSASPACTSAPTCSTNVVTYVQVDTTYAYKPILSFPGMSSTYKLSGHARMRAPY